MENVWLTLITKIILTEKIYFMTTEIDLTREKQPFLMTISFLNKVKVKLQIKQGTIRQKCCQKHEKRFSVSVYGPIRRNNPSPGTLLHAFWMTPYPPTAAFVPN